MHSLQRRAYTSYDGYGDYNSEDLINDMYPMDGAMTPQGYDDRATPMEGRMTPLNGLQSNGRCSPGRPASKMRTPGRPKSRLDVSVQAESYCRSPTTEARARPLPNETQRNYSIPEASVRATTPVQRILNRCHTQPFMHLQGSLPGSNMDPITMQYYHRMWKNQAPAKEMTLNRQGRAGGVWRHVRACVANTGTQLAFIDGTVKEEDNVYFPPFAPRQSNNYSNYAEIPMPNYMMAPQPRSPLRRSASLRNNTFSNRAKAGFKYWYQEPKPIDCRDLAKRRIIQQRVQQPAL